jgi:hypothetical protein
MGRRKSWTDDQLKEAVRSSRSYRAVILKLGLVPAGGNYAQTQERIHALGLDTSHFTGMAWNMGLIFVPNPPRPLEELLIKGSRVQSHLLKRRLFAEGIKEPFCAMCGWCEMSRDGRVPVELDHINGDHYDNRIENLRILCPNCHSLQPTHRGRNKKVALRKKGKI